MLWYKSNEFIYFLTYSFTGIWITKQFYISPNKENLDLFIYIKNRYHVFKICSLYVKVVQSWIINYLNFFSSFLVFFFVISFPRRHFRQIINEILVLSYIDYPLVYFYKNTKSSTRYFIKRKKQSVWHLILTYLVKEM